MNKFIEFLQKHLVPLGNWMTKRKTLNAINAGMRISFPLIMIGCVLNIIANPPVTEQLLQGGGILASFLGAWSNFATTYRDILMTPYNMTMGIMGFVIVISASYSLAKDYKLDPLMTAIISMVMFLVVSAPSQDAVLYSDAVGAIANGNAEGLSKISMMSTQFMGSMGMFVGIFIAILSVNITRFCRDKKIEIKMPDSIPPFVALSFSSIVPLFFNLVIIYGADILLRSLVGASIPQLVIGILMPVVNTVTSPLVMFGLSMLSCMFWSIGIHGGLVNSALIPIFMSACLANGDLVNAGQVPVFQPIFMMTYSYAGGMGCVLALSILMSKCKSKQLKAMGKMGIIPGLFGISEPIMFGTPIILNPILIVPMILSCAAVFVLGYIGFITGILVPPSIPILSVMPIGVGLFLSSNSITNFLFPFVGTALAMLIYYPFVKVYDKQKLDEEILASKEDSLSNSEVAVSGE